MPAMEYPPETPFDSRWDWYIPIPAAWSAYPPAEVVRYATYVFTLNSITHDGGPAEIATAERDGVRYILVKSDVDPMTVIDPTNLPAPPPTQREVWISHLQQFRTAVRGGQAPTAAQTQTVIADMIDILFAMNGID